MTAPARAGIACPACSTESTLVLLTEEWDGDPGRGHARLTSLTCPRTGHTGWPPHEGVRR